MPNVPFAVLVEGNPKLLERHYSRFASFVVSRKILTITTVVESGMIPDANKTFDDAASRHCHLNMARSVGDDGIDTLGV